MTGYPAIDICRQQFLAGLRSETTRRVYRVALDQFEQWLREQGKDWLVTTPNDVQAFRDLLLTQVAPPTVGVRLVALRRFYAQLVNQGLARENPAHVPAPSTSGRGRPATCAASLMVGLLALPDTRTVAGARDALVLHLLGEVGLRVSEICALRQRDVTRRPEVAATGLGLVVGRNTRWMRVVPLLPPLKAALDTYLRLDLPLRRLAKGHTPDAALIQATAANRSIGGRPLTPRHIFNLVRRYGSLLDRTDLNPHMVRRSARMGATS